MASLKDLRNKIKSIKSIQQVTNAMKMVAAAKLRKSQDSMEKARPYTKAIEDTINHLIPDIDRSILPILDSREFKKKLLVVVTADRGMAGAFNGNIIKRTEQLVKEFGNEKCTLICIGKKSHDYFKRRDYQILESYRDFWNSLNVNQAIAIECKEVIVSWSSWLENQRRFSPNTRIAYLHDLEVFLAFLSKHLGQLLVLHP